MLQTVLVGIEYCFRPGVGVTDWFEHHQNTVKQKMNGQAHIHNKQGGLIRLLITGEESTVKKAGILREVEDVTGLVYSHSHEVRFKPEYANVLKRLYGDKAVIK